MAGPRTPTDVMPNKFVEANGYAREVLERTFRFSPKNLGVFAVFGIAVPVIIYKGCVAEFVSASPSPNPTPLHRPIPGTRERRRTSCARRPARGFFPFGDRIRPARGRAPTGGGTLKITTPGPAVVQTNATGERSSRFQYRFGSPRGSSSPLTIHAPSLSFPTQHRADEKYGRPAKKFM